MNLGKFRSPLLIQDIEDHFSNMLEVHIMIKRNNTPYKRTYYIKGHCIGVEIFRHVWIRVFHRNFKGTSWFLPFLFTSHPLLGLEWNNPSSISSLGLEWSNPSSISSRKASFPMQSIDQGNKSSTLIRRKGFFLLSNVRVGAYALVSRSITLSMFISLMNNCHFCKYGSNLHTY